MANSVRWYGHVLRMALDFEVEGKRKTEDDMENAG